MMVVAATAVAHRVVATVVAASHCTNRNANVQRAHNRLRKIHQIAASSVSSYFTIA